MRSRTLKYVVAAMLLALLAVALYFTPPIHSRLAWRVDELVLRIRYRLNPPQEVVFIPSAPLAQPAVRTTHLPTDTPTPQPTPSPDAPGVSPTSAPTGTPTPVSTPLPGKITLSGVRYEDQHGRWNYCAPANLSMALSFWDWEGSRDTVGPVIKPDPKDKNVMPYEMVDFVEDNTELMALSRVGGDLQTIKRFIAAGYPVLIERAAYFRDLEGVVSWMGHYQVITGYDDGKGVFIAQDSFTNPDDEITYADMESYWRGFNHTYILIFPPENEAEIIGLLGEDADPDANYRRAAQRASEEIYSQSGIDQFYAWYNRGTNLAGLDDYASAAQAYDSAFTAYRALPIAERPWRIVWYQTSPYAAYYYSGRYWDVINLADITLSTLQSDKNLEESYYWRGIARQALGDSAGAIEDFRTSLQYHPGFEPPLYQLRLLGLEP